VCYEAAIVIDRRHDTFGINLEVFGFELFILEEIDVLRVVGDSLFRERDEHLLGANRIEEAVNLYHAPFPVQRGRNNLPNEPDIGNPVALAPAQTGLFILALEGCRRASEQRGLYVLKCVDADNGVEAAVDSAGDNRHHATRGAHVKLRSLGAERVF
jgi:hypothetical protein